MPGLAATRVASEVRRSPSLVGAVDGYYSLPLGLWFGVDQPGYPRVYDQDGNPVRNLEEEVAARRRAEAWANAAEEQAQAEAAARRASEDALTVLRAEMEALRSGERPA